MRELILRHAYAARKYGSFASPALAIAPSRSLSPRLHNVRYQSTKPVSASPKTIPVSDNQKPSADSSPPTLKSQRRYGPATAIPQPTAQQSQSVSQEVLSRREFSGPFPNIDTGHYLAVQGLVKDLASTRPPPLELPEPPHPYAWPRKGNWDFKKWDFKYLFGLGKAYGKFYWAGVKQLYANVKIMFKINSQLNGTFPDMAARYPEVPEKISYNDYEMMMRTKRDMKKSIPFLLVLAICGEFTPLVILALGSRVVPGTCVIPKQTLQDRQKMIARDDAYMEEMARILRQCSGDFNNIRNDRDKLIQVQNLIAYRAGLTPFKTPPPIIGRLYYSMRTSRLLAIHSEQLLSAATLVEREGGWSKKSPIDVWEWGTKYGLYELTQYARQAIAKNQDPVSDKMKEAMLPHIKAEMKNIFHEDWTYIPRKSHCTLAINSPFYNRADSDLRRKKIEEMAGLKKG